MRQFQAIAARPIRLVDPSIESDDMRGREFHCCLVRGPMWDSGGHQHPSMGGQAPLRPCSAEQKKPLTVSKDHETRTELESS